MDGLVEFSIPVSGLSDGLHHFDFVAGDAFFSAFEGSPIESGKFRVHVDFEKRPNMYVLDMEHVGTVRTTCDRCMEMIDLPVAGTFRLLVKFSEEPLPEEAEVVYVHPGIARLQIARFIYEAIVLSLPLINRYDCEADAEAPCNEETLRHLEGSSEREAIAPPNNPLREALKNWKKDN